MDVYERAYRYLIERKLERLGLKAEIVIRQRGSQEPHDPDVIFQEDYAAWAAKRGKRSACGG